MASSPEPSQIQELIRTRLAAARQQVKRLSALNLVFTLANVLAGALATLIAALAAVLGGAALQGGGTLVWQVICAFVAIFSFVSTAAGGLSQQLGVAEKLSQSRACAGRLDALETALALGSQQPDEVVKEYSRIQAEFPTVLG